jgi:hypothetical protein
MDLVVRTRGGGFRADDLRTTIASIAPGVPIYGLSTMEQKIAGTLEASHFDTFCLLSLRPSHWSFRRSESTEFCPTLWPSARAPLASVWPSAQPKPIFCARFSATVFA